jgi:type II secretory ATPase GspE/PulE/Tfp pilus assembly ATPase PilB-like protein
MAMSDSTLPEEPVEFHATDLVHMQAEEAVVEIVRHAVDLNASDLFLLSNQKSATVSVRANGNLIELAVVPGDLGRQMLGYIKAQSGMDIAEHRRPQDGRWVIQIDDERIDMRLSLICTLNGEDLAVRIADGKHGRAQLDQLGMSTAQLSQFKGMLETPAGLILVTGPTGTGKTTTLYSALKYLSDGTRKINTIEDPVESLLPGVRQSQVAPKIGLTFAELLRSILRQAPDVIMVGEIRDEETAQTAIRAANSGLLVLATMHAPIASAPIQSLLALGTKPFFLANCLLGVVAQQLVRVLCPACRLEIDISESPETFQEVRHLLENSEGQKDLWSRDRM